MRKRIERALPFFIALILCGSLVAGGLTACSTSTPSEDPKSNTKSESNSDPNKGKQEKVRIEKGATAPDFTFTTTEGATAKLSDYQGKVVLLNFWATWCGYCIDEMPALQKITETYPDTVVVLAINRGDSNAEAEAFAQENDYNFTWGLDDAGTIQGLYPANGIPYSVIIDKDGVITGVFEGSAPDMYPYFEEAVKAAGV